jgi:hypothetical protein
VDFTNPSYKYGLNKLLLLLPECHTNQMFILLRNSIRILIQFVYICINSIRFYFIIQIRLKRGTQTGWPSASIRSIILSQLLTIICPVTRVKGKSD